MCSLKCDDIWLAYVKDVAPLNTRTIATTSPNWHRIERRQFGSTLDLHGMTVADAHAQTIEMLAAACYRYRSITIVTGVSGVIRQEFPHWVEAHHAVRRVEPLNGGGAFRIHFRRQRDE